MNQPNLPEHVQAFFNPETYDHPVQSIIMIQTHISWVFLTGDFAYKLKKPVNFGFVNFSTLAKRKYFCERELTLNRRLSNGIYIDVYPIYKGEKSYNLVGLGEVVDYCLKMKQFDQAGLLNEKLTKGELQPYWMDILASDIAHFHATAEINTNPNFDHLILLTEHIQNNLDIAEQHSNNMLTPIQLEALSSFAQTVLKKQHVFLKQRQTNHFIRHCHGDLHFKNITLFEHKPLIFDCIEFNDAFRIIDTMNDVAFLVMDCDAYARPDLGFRFLSRYLEHTGDYAGLALLPLYLFYRAGVRGKVASLLASELTLAQQAPHWAEAKRYFELALTYSQNRKPTLFAIGGLSGSGKSHLALLGCGKTRAIIIRSDATRKRVHTNYPHLALYSTTMHRHTYQAMFRAAQMALAAGFSVILDATFLNLASRQEVFHLAQQNQVNLQFYWLDMDEKILRQRIRQRIQTNHDISDANLHVLDLQLANYQQPHQAWIQLLYTNEVWPSH